MSKTARKGGWSRADVFRIRKNIRVAFDAADEMVGIGDPEFFEEEKERIRNARRMVLSFIADAEKSLVKLKRKAVTK